MKSYFDIENFMPCYPFFFHSEGWSLLDGPVDDPPPSPPPPISWNSVSVHADDPHHHLHRRRPRDSRRAAAASKRTTPQSTVGRWRIRSVCFSAPISVQSACASVLLRIYTIVSVRKISVVQIFRDIFPRRFSKRIKARGIKRASADFAKSHVGVCLCVTVCVCGGIYQQWSCSVCMCVCADLWTT